MTLWKIKKNDPTLLYDLTTDDGIRHRVWQVLDNEVIQNIRQLFSSQVPAIYIADGHHRTAAGALVGRELRNAKNGTRSSTDRDNFLLSVLFSAQSGQDHGLQPRCARPQWSFLLRLFCNSFLHTST